MSATTTLDGRPAVRPARPVERRGTTGARPRTHPRAATTPSPQSRRAPAPPTVALAARPRSATPVFVDGGRRARLVRLVGRLTALALTAWIALTAAALVGPHWADGLELRSERAVAHVDAADPDEEPASDDRADDATLFTSPVSADDATTDRAPRGLLGPMASRAPDAPEADAPAPDAPAPATNPSPDAQDRAGAALADEPASRRR